MRAHVSTVQIRPLSFGVCFMRVIDRATTHATKSNCLVGFFELVWASLAANAAVHVNVPDHSGANICKSHAGGRSQNWPMAGRDTASSGLSLAMLTAVYVENLSFHRLPILIYDARDCPNEVSAVSANEGVAVFG